MGDVSIIARRLTGGWVQYGWSGNSGRFGIVGSRLLNWYQDPEDVDYLFDLGQTRLIGKKGSERGGFARLESHWPTGEPMWLGKTERSIFSKIAFIYYGYFFDFDNRWYYIIPGPFRIKIPLDLIADFMESKGDAGEEYESEYRRTLERMVNEYIFDGYRNEHPEFDDFLKAKHYDIDEIKNVLKNEDSFPGTVLFDRYNEIFKYFDDWVLIKGERYNSIDKIILHKKSEAHLETIEW